MRKNKGQAIVKNIFMPGGRTGTQVCSTTFVTAVIFVFSIFICVFSWFAYYYGYNTYNRTSGASVIINAPDSFFDYVAEHPIERRHTFRRDPVAAYDFLTMSDIMHKYAAGTVIYFPENFEEDLIDGKEPQILTYYRTDTLRYRDVRDELADVHLEGYRQYVIDLYGIKSATSEMEVIRYDVPTEEGSSHNRLANNLGRTFIPILMFVVILYAAMASGTEAIAGQKERGTFSRILLTPVKRSDIASAFTAGVFLRALTPALVLSLLVFLIPVYHHWLSVFTILILIMSMALFVASLTVLISLMNDSVSSAQAAFLPVFFILITVAVSCINGDNSAERLYLFIPIYGHFYGLGDAFNGSPDNLASLCCALITALLAFIVIIICGKMLSSERFTTNMGAEEEKKDDDPASSVFAEKLMTVIDILFYPLAVLSIVQLLAMIPVIIAYTRDPLYSDFIAGLSGVSTISGILEKTMEVLGIFMNDARFLALMTVGYIIIILLFIWRGKSAASVGLTAKDFGRRYGTGAVMGILMMTLVFILLCITRKAVPQGFGLTSKNIVTFIFSMIMWIPQGASEEVMFRGFMIPKLKSLFGEKRGKAAAVILSSVLFAVFHGMNQGVTALALINIFLLAVLFALIYEKAGNIILTCAAHTMWNMFQGNIYGLSVSGNASVPSIISTSYTGSAFGPEGTVEATVVIVIALAVFMFLSTGWCAKSRSKSR